MMIIQNATTSSAKVLAINVLVIDELRMSIGETMFNVIVSSFHGDIVAYVEALRHNITVGNANAARRSAHQLAGLMSTFGADLAACTAQCLSNEADDFEVLRAASEQLMPEIEAAISALNDIISGRD